MQRAWHRAREIYRDGGLRATIAIGLRKLISPVAEVGSVYFLERDLSEPSPPVRPVPGIIPREAFLSELHLLDGTENAAARKADGVERFKKGDRWFVGIDASNGRLTNYRWVTTSSELIPELGRHVVPKPGEAFVYALYTLPEYRRRGIDHFTRQYTYDVLYKSGIKRIIATIFGDNHISQKSGRPFLKTITRVWYVTVRGCNTLMFMRPNPKMPTLAPAPPSLSPSQAADRLTCQM